MGTLALATSSFAWPGGIGARQAAVPVGRERA